MIKHANNTVLAKVDLCGLPIYKLPLPPYIVNGRGKPQSNPREEVDQMTKDKKVGQQINLAEGTYDALTDDQKTAYDFLLTARGDEDRTQQRKARRMLRRTGIYLSRVDGHSGEQTLKAKAVQIQADTPKKAEERSQPVKTRKGKAQVIPGEKMVTV